MATKKKVVKPKKAPQATEVLDPNPLLMATLLEAKAALLRAETAEAYVVIQKMAVLEMSLPTKTVWAASAMRHAKAMSEKQMAGVQAHPEEVQELLTRFYML